jgi:hypothetical protein
MPTAPADKTLAVRTHNFHNVQIDAVEVGLTSAAGSFLPVFLLFLLPIEKQPVSDHW